MNKRTFNTAKSAQGFAVAKGVDAAFFHNAAACFPSSKVLLFLYPNEETFCAIGIVYLQSFEIDIWVHPQHRRKGLGNAILGEMLVSLLHKNSRLFAQLDLRDCECKLAMTKILQQNGFRQMINASGPLHNLWLRQLG